MDDYDPIKPPNFLEGILILIVMLVSRIFFRRHDKRH